MIYQTGSINNIATHKQAGARATKKAPIDINELDEKTKDAIMESAINLNIEPSLLLVKIKEILGETEIISEAIIQASIHTKNEINNKYRSNPVRHPLAFFLGTIRNMYKNGTAQLLSIKQSNNKNWDKIKSQIKNYMAKSTFNYFINNIKTQESNNILYLYISNKQMYDFIYEKYLGSIMYYSSKENLKVELCLVQELAK